MKYLLALAMTTSLLFQTIICLAEEKGERDVMKRSPFEPNESVFSRGLGLEIIWIGVLMGVISLGIGFVGWLRDPSGPWQTMVFTTMVLAQMGNALAIRSNRDSLFNFLHRLNRFHHSFASLLGVV